MLRLPSPLRVLALLLTALQLASRPVATWVDARLAAAAVRAAAEGSLVHAEDGSGADCERIHEADCELCRVVAASAQRTAPVAAVPTGTSGDAATMPRAVVAVSAPRAGPESARPPPSA